MPKNAFAAGAAPGAPAAFYSERIMDSQENLRQKAKAKVQSAVLVLALAALAAAVAEYRRATAPSATASLVIEMPEDAVSAAKGENAAHKAKAAAENAGGGAKAADGNKSDTAPAAGNPGGRMPGEELRKTLAAVAAAEHHPQGQPLADVPATAPKSRLSAPTAAELEKQAAAVDDAEAEGTGADNTGAGNTGAGNTGAAPMPEDGGKAAQAGVADTAVAGGNAADFLNYMRDVHRRVAEVSKPKSPLEEIKAVRQRLAPRPKQALFQAGRIEIYDSEKGVVAVETTVQTVAAGKAVNVAADDKAVERAAAEAEKAEDKKAADVPAAEAEKDAVADKSTAADEAAGETGRTEGAGAVMLVPAAMQGGKAANAAAEDVNKAEDTPAGEKAADVPAAEAEKDADADKSTAADEAAGETGRTEDAGAVMLVPAAMQGAKAANVAAEDMNKAEDTPAGEKAADVPAAAAEKDAVADKSAAADESEDKGLQAAQGGAVDKNELLRSVLQAADEIARAQNSTGGEEMAAVPQVEPAPKANPALAVEPKPEDGGAIDLMKNIAARN